MIGIPSEPARLTEGTELAGRDGDVYRHELSCLPDDINITGLTLKDYESKQASKLAYKQRVAYSRGCTT